MIKSIKENVSQRSHPLTLIFNNYLHIEIAIRLKQLLEMDQSANQKLLLKFTNVNTYNSKEALAMIKEEKHPILHKFISLEANRL